MKDGRMAAAGGEADAAFEAQVRAAAARLAYPSTPDIAGRVSRRLSRERSRVFPPVRPGWIVVRAHNQEVVVGEPDPFLPIAILNELQLIGPGVNRQDIDVAGLSIGKGSA